MSCKNYIRSLYFLSFILLTGITPLFAQCYIDNVNDRANVRLWMSDGDSSNNNSDSWAISCGPLGEVIEPVTSQPAEWKKYISDIAKIYAVPENEIKASLIFRLNSQGGGNKTWKFDMTKNVITTDSQPYQLQPNQKYTLTVEQVLGSYKSYNIPNQEVNIESPNDLDLLWRKEHAISPIASISSVFLPSTRTCTASSFIVTPSASEVHFGTIDIRAINRGGVYTKEFTIEVRRNPADVCAVDIIQPEIRFIHYGGSTNGDGDLILPRRQMLFRLTDNYGSKIFFRQYYPMGELNKVSPLIVRYKAQVLKDPDQVEIIPGEFTATIYYEVKYQ